MMSKGIFITGTGTDIGKTYIAALITKRLADSGRSAGYFKAAMSGNDTRPDGTLIPGDALHVKTISGIPQPLEEMCPYVYENAYSPHLASRLEGGPVEMSVVLEAYAKAGRSADLITAEGSGGILCPIRWDAQDASESRPPCRIMLEDVIRQLSLPSLLVADAGLGTINSVVLTAEYMRAKDLPVKGIIFNHWHPGDVMEEDNLRMCEKLTGLDVIACVKDGDTEFPMEADALAALYE